MEDVKKTASLSLPKKRIRRPLSIIEKETILEVFKAYDIKHPDCCSKSEKVNFTATATGAGVTSVYKVLKEQNEKGRLQPPSAFHRRKSLLDKLTEEDINYIRNKVNSLFTQNQNPSISMVLAAVNEEAKYSFRRTSFWKVLKMLNLSCIDEPEDMKMGETELLDSNNIIRNGKFTNEIIVKTEESPILEDGECFPARDLTLTVDIEHSKENTYSSLNAIEELPNEMKLETEEAFPIEKSYPSDFDESVDMKTEENEFLNRNNLLQYEEYINKIWIKTEERESPIFFPEDNIELGLHKKSELVVSALKNCKDECEGDGNSFCEDSTNLLDRDMPVKQENQDQTSNGISATMDNASSTYEHQKSIKCKFCDYTAGNCSSMKRHIDKNHDELKNHKCDHCGYSAITSTGLKKHIRRVHEKLKNHQCQLCERRFFNTSALKFHVTAVHQKLKNHKCEQCDFTATTLGNLKQHINAVHYKLKNYKCDHCDFSASQSSNLKFHVKAVHCKVKNFKCEYCDYTSSALMHLKEHISAVHHKIKDQNCEYCDYIASKSSTPKRHISAVHFKLKTHKCKYCSYAASQPTVLTLHIKTVHHKIKDKKCEHCDHTTSSSSNLKKHIRSVHGNKM